MTKSRVVKVYMPEHTYQQLTDIARRAHLPMSAVIRLSLLRAFPGLDFERLTDITAIDESLTRNLPTE